MNYFSANTNFVYNARKGKCFCELDYDVFEEINHMIASSQNKEHHHIAPVQVKPSHKLLPLFLPQSLITHNPKAGLNPLVDACSTIFSTIAKLKTVKNLRQLNPIQQELIQQIESFQAVIKGHSYNAEYIAVCRYVLAAFCDDIIANTSWGGDGRWDNFALLNVLHQDTKHHEKFFGLIERCLKEPELYIDLMELIYICLSLGYKGEYRTTEFNQYQLEQITNNLYRHIRAHRGQYSKVLSPSSTNASPITTMQVAKESNQAKKPSLLLVFLTTACVIMLLFIALSYLMDILTNEAFKSVKEVHVPFANENVKL